MARVAINGLGRIGRAALEVLLDLDGIEVAAVNDLVPVENLVYLLRYDTVYGRYREPVSVKDGRLIVGRRSILAHNRRDPPSCPGRTGVGAHRDRRHDRPGREHPSRNAQIVSCARCTTNCIAPVMEVLHDGAALTMR